MRPFQKIAGALLAAVLLFSSFPCHALAISTSAVSAILVDVDSGRVLYEQNADARMLIASTTKILTALVAIEEGDLPDTVKVSREAACTEGSSMYLKEGEELTLETLLLADVIGLAGIDVQGVYDEIIVKEQTSLTDGRGNLQIEIIYELVIEVVLEQSAARKLREYVTGGVSSGNLMGDYLLIVELGVEAVAPPGHAF